MRGNRVSLILRGTTSKTAGLLDYLSLNGIRPFLVVRLAVLAVHEPLLVTAPLKLDHTQRNLASLQSLPQEMRPSRHVLAAVYILSPDRKPPRPRMLP